MTTEAIEKEVFNMCTKIRDARFPLYQLNAITEMLSHCSDSPHELEFDHKKVNGLCDLIKGATDELQGIIGQLEGAGEKITEMMKSEAA